MKTQAVQIFKVYQKNDQPSIGTGQSETFYMKVINLRDNYFSAILDHPELERASRFIEDTDLVGWSFASYFVEVEGRYYETMGIKTDHSINNLQFQYSNQLDEDPFDVKW
jgi:hypothetical protein